MELLPHEIVEQNLRTAMRFFGRASGTGCIEEHDGIVTIDAGVNYPVFNISMLTRPVESLVELDARLTIASRWYAARRTRWSHWLCDHSVPLTLTSRVPDIFSNHRMRLLTDAPGMIAEKLLPPTRPLPAIRMRIVNDAQTRIEFAHVATVSFDIPFPTAKLIYDREEAWLGDYVGYLAYAGTKAVSAAAVVVEADATGFYSVGTLPGYRNRGYAEALMREAHREVQRTAGLERTVLQSTSAGYEMYRRMGYRDVTRFSVFLL